MAEFKLTKRPESVISYGMLRQESEKEIQDWLKFNMRKFLLEKMHISKGSIEPYIKDLERFCEDVYIEIYDVGYQEGSEAERVDSVESF